MKKGRSPLTSFYRVEVQKSLDGSDTLYVPELDEHYHSVNGALTESKLVFLRNGFSFLIDKYAERGEPMSDGGEQSQPIRVLEVGFGTGLNCLLTLLESHRRGIQVAYHGLENSPLSPEVVSALNYPRITGDPDGEWFGSIHRAEWNRGVRLSSLFELVKWNLDFTFSRLEAIPPCDLIYFDAFAPGKQPEMWSLPLFIKLFEKTVPGGVLVTYSASGKVRRELEAAGFRMERVAGPPGKREMLRGIRQSGEVDREK